MPSTKAASISFHRRQTSVSAVSASGIDGSGADVGAAVAAVGSGFDVGPVADWEDKDCLCHIRQLPACRCLT